MGRSGEREGAARRKSAGGRGGKFPTCPTSSWGSQAFFTTGARRASWKLAPTTRPTGALTSRRSPLPEAEPLETKTAEARRRHAGEPPPPARPRGPGADGSRRSLRLRLGQIVQPQRTPPHFPPHV